ncbi:hypothetical protein EDF57_103338 [Novosphingobium sp. PhB55]|nr:hypothetical protein EDF57_103338 [Novosphingobium sp. PhB55]
MPRLAPADNRSAPANLPPAPRLRRTVARPDPARIRLKRHETYENYGEPVGASRPPVRFTICNN